MGALAPIVLLGSATRAWAAGRIGPSGARPTSRRGGASSGLRK